MRPLYRWTSLFLFFLGVSCGSSKRTTTSADDGKLEVIFVQVNDVYEIAPTAGGTSGGMARVATVKKKFARQNQNTFLVMAGDFLSPSVYNSLTFENKRIRGRQMVDAMNIAGTDLAVFGNHEFDITESELQERINESRFQWIASNSFHKKGGQTSAFQKLSFPAFSFPETLILSMKDSDGTQVKIGFIGLTLPYNRADYVSYKDPLSTAEQLFNRIKDSCDAVVAITHQRMADDIQLAQRLPNLAAILGGHEHDMRYEKEGAVTITKAHANAKSAFIIKLVVDRKAKTNSVTTDLRLLDTSVSLDRPTDSVVKRWTTIANESYTSFGFDATKIIVRSGDSLDGRDAETRTRATNLTDLIVAAMADACPQADAAIVNGGSIRLDDILYPPITQYDILRTLPFGGSIREAEIKGSLLLQVLEAGQRNVGSGGFLHYHPIQFLPSPSDPTNAQFTLKGQVIDSTKIYRVAFSDYLVSGKEANLGFLTKENPGMIKLYPADTSRSSAKSDIRMAIIRYMEKLNR